MKDKEKETDNSTDRWRKIISHTFGFSWSASQKRIEERDKSEDTFLVSRYASYPVEFVE
jgi:hypothetical protein